MDVFLPLFVSLAVCGYAVGIFAIEGPRACLAASAGAVLLGIMLAAVAAAADEPVLRWIAVGCLMAGILGVFGCAAHRWLPR